MKKITLGFLLLVVTLSGRAQTINTVPISDWNTMRHSGFYESITSQTLGLPANYPDYFWGINIAHTSNKGTTNIPYYWGAQIAFGINRNDQPPLMYVRSTNINGQGKWAKVLTDNGNQIINGALNVHTLNCTDDSNNGLRSVLARLSEGKDEGEGTFLGVRSYYTQPASTKSFSLEHKFYGLVNNSINFYRGGSKIGGYIGIGVYDGREIAKFHVNGLSVAGTVSAREVKVEINAGADYVFEPDYNLKPLSEVETFIKENKHLPEIQSENQMQKEGLNVNEFQIKLLQKIEELTLYVIEQEKRTQEQEKRISEQEQQIVSLRNQMKSN